MDSSTSTAAASGAPLSLSITTTPSLTRSSSASSLSSTGLANTSLSSPKSPLSPASASSLRSRRSSNLTLDLSSMPPPLQPPAQPTNTLLFTNLDHADIFRPDNLETIRDLVSQSAPLHSWAPLKSFHRIVASFYSAEDAARVRAVWEGESILGSTCQVYFGRPTPVDLTGKNGGVQHLALPDAGKLFFISPPPSPPHDWEMRLEGAPNKQVHAEDLADALARLHHQAAAEEDVAMRSPESAGPSATSTSASGAAPRTGRSRSSTLVIYQPAEHGSHPHLPAIAVEDMTDSSTDEELNHATWSVGSSDSSPIAERPITLTHTARPPVELMQDA